MVIIQHTEPNPANEGDVMRRLVEAIAQELWGLYGRDGALDWAGAERRLGRIVERARVAVGEPGGTPDAPAAGANGPTGREKRRARSTRFVEWRWGGDAGPSLQVRRRAAGRFSRKDFV